MLRPLSCLQELANLKFDRETEISEASVVLGGEMGIMGEARVLIVRHGEGRGAGANPNYMRRALRDLERERPELHRRLVLHHTGALAPSLSGIGAVVFWLKNPLRRYPACHAEAVRIAEGARKNSIPLINPPEVLADFCKSRVGHLWRAAGIPTPEAERLDTFESLRDAASRLQFPVVVRADEEHAQKATRLVSDSSALRKLEETDLIFPCVVSPFIDLRSGYRDAAPRSAFARLFHKKRLIVAGGVIRSKHLMFSSSPFVAAKTSIFNKARRFGRFENLFLLSRLHRQCVAHDLAYWQHGEEREALLLKACEALGLKYAALDYGTSFDGTHLLWEANPLFGIPKAEKIMLPRARRAGERVTSYHAAIGTFLSGLLAERPMTTGEASPPLRISAG